MTIFLPTSCKKEKTAITVPVTNNNKPPVAIAGQDVTITPLACGYSAVFTELDGSGSYSQYSHIKKFLWRRVSGPSSYIFNNSDYPKTKVGNLTSGIYSFELRVTDAEGLFSKDTVLVNVIEKKATAYDLDISYEGSYSVITYPSWDYDTYYKYTEISGNIYTPPFGEMQILIDEYSDNPGNAFIHIRKGDPDQVYLEGNVAVNLGELIRLGGGPFNGTVNITQGSARVCDTNIFDNLPPLTITGNLSVTGELVSFRIKGKVYF
jgi:hypothetical protein